MNDSPDVQIRHPRDSAIEAAVGEFLPFLSELRGRHALTAAETSYVLLAAAGRITGAVCLAEREGITQQKAPPGG